MANTTPKLSLLTPAHWQNYALLGSGGFEKLERFGPYTLLRPEPQAIWPAPVPRSEWQAQTDAVFAQQGSHSGTWEVKAKMPESWPITYQGPDYALTLRLARTGFKHVGLFPEQAANWDYIYQVTRSLAAGALEPPKVLNLFAYTGGASLAAALGGAAVTHVDAIRQVVNWAADNAALNHINSIRWIVEDALKFVQREARRGARYQGIILDPPSFGHGAKGERWKLEEQLPNLLELLSQLLDTTPGSFLVLNCYAMGLSPLVLENLVELYFHPEAAELGELYLPDPYGRKLPAGFFARFHVN